MSYQLVEDLQKKACPKVTVSQACRILEVSRSSYYANVAVHKQRLAEPALCAASVHLKAAFAASHKAYGSRRLRTAMAERGQPMGRQRVRTLMRLNGLRPVWRRKLVHTTARKAVGCIWQRGWICIRARSWAWRWPMLCLRRWYALLCKWPSFKEIRHWG